MNFDDMMVVERFLCDQGWKRPVARYVEDGSVRVDVHGMSTGAVDLLVDRLAQDAGRKGYDWDVWKNQDLGTVYVSERRRDED